MSKSITQDMAYRQSLMKYAEKYGVSRASRKYNKSRSYIYFWKTRWDGTIESLVCQSRRPHHHPNQHTEEVPAATPPSQPAHRGGTEADPGYAPEKSPPWHGGVVAPPTKVVPRRCIANPELRLFQYTAIDEFTRLRFLAAYPEQSTYSSADFLKKLVMWYARRGIRVECVQTDNGIEFTNRFFTGKQDRPTLFEATATQLGIRHKLIRPYTPRHNGKVERSHREDQKRFYSSHSFFSLDDFAKQLAVHNRRSNNFPMRPLKWLSPSEFAVQYV